MRRDRVLRVRHVVVAMLTISVLFSVGWPLWTWGSETHVTSWSDFRELYTPDHADSLTFVLGRFFFVVAGAVVFLKLMERDRT